MRIEIPQFSTKAQLFEYLRSNKKQLIAQKKSMPIKSEPFFCGVFSGYGDFKTIDTKAAPTMPEDTEEVVRRRVIANTMNWMDSHSDVLLNDSPKKSISERKKLIPHIHDHIHEIAAKVGEVVDITIENFTLAQLGLSGNRQTQAVVFTTDIYKSYNEKIFNQYKLGNVNQHSIGLQYLQLELALNDENDTEHFAVWNKYIDLIINKQKAMDQGFFWAVKEYKLFENSAVLFGSNELTPTLGGKNTESPGGTHKTGSEESTPKSNLKNHLLIN